MSKSRRKPSKLERLEALAQLKMPEPFADIMASFILREGIEEKESKTYWESIAQEMDAEGLESVVLDSLASGGEGWVLEGIGAMERSKPKPKKASPNARPQREIIREKDAQLELYDRVGGQLEVPTPMGNIDLLTEDQLIEVKSCKKDLKPAIGQVISYGIYYPLHEKRIHLCHVTQKFLGSQKYKEFQKACNAHAIVITF